MESKLVPAENGNLPSVGQSEAPQPRKLPRLVFLEQADRLADAERDEESDRPDASLQPPEPGVRAYRKRFLMLALFSLYSMSNAFQWIQYAIVASIIAPHFGVSLLSINLTSMLYMIIYIPGILPASWLLNRRGLRFCVLLGAFGTCAGSCLKCFCRGPDQFWLLMAGQTLVAASQLFIINIPPNLAAVWFPANELSSATAVGVFGNQLGVALGFVVPPVLVTVANPGGGLNELHLYLFCVTLVVLVLILVCFAEKPPSPPSLAQAQSQLHNSGRGHHQVLRSLFTNPNFNLLFVTYGINVGVFYAMSTLLEQMVTSRHAGGSAEAGQMGLMLTIAGMFGSVVCGIFLDKTHLYKLTTILLYTLSFTGMLFWTGALYLQQIWPLYLVSIFLGFFMTGYLPIGFEFAAELTYPQPEGTSAGLLNASAQVRWIFPSDVRIA